VDPGADTGTADPPGTVHALVGVGAPSDAATVEALRRANAAKDERIATLERRFERLEELVRVDGGVASGASTPVDTAPPTDD
jgi:hypothetical protein